MKQQIFKYFISTKRFSVRCQQLLTPKMNKIRCLFVFLLIASCKQKEPSLPVLEKPTKDKALESAPTFSKYDLSGEWYWSTEETEFTLSINQRGDSIFGTYCAIAQNGHRIDCDDETNPTYCIVQGRLQGNSATILYNSAWSEEAERDTAVITYNAKDSSLLWTAAKRNILSYVPGHAVLKR